MSTASAIEPLRAANLLAGRTLYALRMLSVAGGVVRSSAGSQFETEAVSEAGDHFDLVLVVAGGNPIAVNEPALTGWLRRLAARGVRLGGISGGAAVLARAGLMAGRRFTVHWDHFDALKDLSDDFIMERRIFVIDRDRVSCAGGVAALDMMHALITADHGADFARQVSDWFIHTRIREPDDPQRAGLAEQWGTNHAALLTAIEMMQSHIADPLDAEQLAALAGIGARQLQRLFSQQQGRRMMDFYRRLRLEKADDLLRQTQLSVGQIAQATGFVTPAHFARAFRAEYGAAPRDRRLGHLRKEVAAERGAT
ncbi:GlxA family transcriptional regulator [Paracoccus pacificus]|uniref:GlxA family transcriptional regulator n=1 Tax=Paracoccus pacificus TaxID=1463598 RepID=A0ABW4R6F2_9RHOB